MGDDIFKVAEEFRRKGKFVREMNSTVIVLIPKKKKISSMTDYRPISLSNTLYKIVSKALVNRLKSLLDKIISGEQHGFVPRREIVDNIIMAGETIHSMLSDKKQGMIVKLDVSKAYDRVRWPYLLDVLLHFGFNRGWVKCIEHCVSSVNFSVLVNGSVCGFF